MPPAVRWETCRIRFHNRRIKAHFFAIGEQSDHVIARSPYFKVKHADGEAELNAPQALRALVDELTAAGWRQTGTGPAPWDLRFERGVELRRPVAPQARR
jgi:hypothetical protein